MQRSGFMRCAVGAAAGLLLAGLAGTTEAAIVTLNDLNAEVKVATAGEIDAPNGVFPGMYNWVVDGTDHLKQQWFWLRVSSDNPLAEKPVDALVGQVKVNDNNFNPGDDTLSMQYLPASGPQYRVRMTYSLHGGLLGSGTSDIGEQITVDNLSTQPLTFNVFQYSDFDLNNTPANDTTWIANGSGVVAKVSDPQFIAAETVLTPDPAGLEVNYFGVPTSTLNRLGDVDVDDLDNNDGPLTGDTTWAFQWTFTLEPNKSFSISKDKQITTVPEPTGLAMLGVAALALARRRRK